MAMLDIGGHKVTVGDEFLKLSPEQQGAAVEEIASSLGGAKPSIAEDVAKSGGIGVVKGGLGLAGASGDVREFVAKGLGKASGALGYEIPAETTSKMLKTASPGGILAGPTSQQLRGALEGVTGPLYEPKTTAGEYAQTTGEFLPGVIGGPTSIARKAVTRVLAPALTSETAGQAAREVAPAAEPYARIAGALAAGGGAAALESRAAARATAAPVPPVDQIRAAGRAAYQHPEIAAVQIHPAALDSAATRIAGDLHGQGFRANNTPQTFAAIEELRTVAGPTARVADVDAVRKNLGEIAREVNAIGRPTAEATAAGRALRQVDGYLANLQQPDLIAGNAQRASTILNEARQDWASAAKAGDIGARLTRAERQAAKSGSGSNIDNAIRQKISAVLDVPSRTVGLRPEEIAQAERVVRGTAATNTLRKVGKLGFNDGLTLMAHAIAAVPTAGASVAVGTVGTIARKVGEMMTERNARRLEEMIRSRSAEAGRGRAMQARINAANPIPQPIDPRIAATVSALLAERQTQNAP